MVMETKYNVNYFDVTALYDRLIEIIKLGLDENADFEEMFDLYLNTYIFFLCKDGLYLQCLPVDYEDEDLEVVLNALTFESIDNIDTIMIWDVQNVSINTNNKNITTESIEQFIVNNNPCFPINYYFENFCADKINRDLGMSLYQGFTSDMVNNLKNWDYNND